jgi:hypothetical protein
MTISEHTMDELVVALRLANEKGDRGRPKPPFDEARARKLVAELPTKHAAYERYAAEHAARHRLFAKRLQAALTTFKGGLDDGSDEAADAARQLAAVGSWAAASTPDRTPLQRLIRTAYFAYFDLAHAEPKASFKWNIEVEGRSTFEGPFFAFVQALASPLGVAQPSPDGIRSALKKLRAETRRDLDFQLALAEPPPDRSRSSAEVFGNVVERLSQARKKPTS